MQDQDARVRTASKYAKALPKKNLGHIHPFRAFRKKFGAVQLLLSSEVHLQQDTLEIIVEDYLVRIMLNAIFPRGKFRCRPRQILVIPYQSFVFAHMMHPWSLTCLLYCTTLVGA